MEQQYKYLRMCGIFGIISLLSYLLAVVFSPYDGMIFVYEATPFTVLE